MGVIEPGTVAPADDPLWTEEEGQVLLCQTDDIETEARVEELRQQLKFGEDMATEDKDTFEQVLLSHADVFALTDEKLGETSLVTHHIDTEDAKPVRTLHCQLPYAVRRELEEELDKLMQIGCVDLSSSPYASPLVLVRKKEGGLRVCVDYHNIN